MSNDQLLQMLAESQARQTVIMEALAATKGLHTKAPATIGTFTGVWQPGGVLSVPGTDRDVFSAHIRPMGISSVLPFFPGNEDNPRFGSITGFTATSGAQAVNPCDDNPAGYMKGCYLTARFGRTAFDTQTIEWDKVRRKSNRGVFDDLILRGRLLGLTDLTPSNLNEGQVLNVITMSEMVTAGVAMERSLTVQDWTGSPAVATAGGGYIEYPGLDNQIATGQVDAETNIACPALDSDVKDFGYNDVEGTNPNIVRYVNQMEYFLRFNAQRMGLMPVEWVIAMRPEMWEILSEIWPCQYNTNRCANSLIGTQAELIVNGGEMVALRDAMRAELFIDVNGRRYRVVRDDGIFEQNSTNDANLNAGQFASSIYFVPMVVNGNFPVTYRQHVDYRLGSVDTNLMPPGMVDFWTDRGVYSWAYEGTKWCYKLSLKCEHRIVLRTPQLAGKIQNVLYSPLQHLRSPYPDSPYFADGGVSTRTGGSTYAVWL